MTIKDVIDVFEDLAPLGLQESYDNSGLTIGNEKDDVSSALLCLDVTEEVIEEAVSKGCGLIISHHPGIFGSLKKLSGGSFTEKVVVKAIRNNISLYAVHTNIDVISGGVNSKISEKLGLMNTRILSPKRGLLRKLVFFVPKDNAAAVRSAVFNAGAGHIGEYDQCSFNLEGEGSFRGSENTDPFVGKSGTLHFENEVRVETVFPFHMESRIVKSMIESHPYEEVAYDIYPLENKWYKAGMGMIGELDPQEDSIDFLGKLKKIFSTGIIRYTEPGGKKLAKVAVCGGSGGSLIETAKTAGADIFVTGDLKYHDFFNAGSDMMIADIGHFESEQFTIEIFHELLMKKMPNFAVHFSDINTNPIRYFT